MNSTPIVRSMICFLLGIGLLNACNLPAQPNSTSSKTQSATPTNTNTPIYTVTPIKQSIPAEPTITFTPLPDQPDFNQVLNSGPPPTLPPSITVTNLPPIPDFDQTLSFSLGGGGDMDPCAFPGHIPAVFGNPSYGLLDQDGILCLWGLQFGMPFTLRLISPGGQVVLENQFQVDHSTYALTQGNNPAPQNGSAASWTDNGTRLDMAVLWPFNLPSGRWQMVASGDGINSSGFLDVKPPTKTPKILAEDNRFGKEIILLDKTSRHSVDPCTDGSIVISGSNFPPSSEVYVLLYGETNVPFNGSLIRKASLISDSNGDISMNFTGPFLPGKNYYLLGVSPGVPVGINGYFNKNAVAADYFYISTPANARKLIVRPKLIGNPP